MPSSPSPKHGVGSEKEIQRLRSAYIDAQNEAEALSSRDDAAIKAVLAKPI
ncbi:hypothetical protein P3W24_15970 [Luteibacter sp. PPL201]|uniref:Uncharacterized protein n=1 Tax=Luteibacter sahnii TaxID=3021977 RepID=A0ABT6BEI4_9GAMM